MNFSKIIKTYFLAVSFVSLFPASLLAQENNFDVGSFNTRNSQGAFYDYSEANKLNIRVSVWGYVRYPGRYVIPNGSTVTDLLSYAGGPTPEAFTDEIKYFRMKEDSSYSVQPIDYEDVLYGDLKVKSTVRPIRLEAGDIISIPGTQRMYAKDWFSMTMSFISVIISISILIFK